MARAEAKYTITADDKTRRGVRSAERNLDRLKAGAVSFGAKLAGVMAAAGVAVVGLGTKINQTAERLNRLNRLGQDVGTVGAQTSQLGFIAEQKDLQLEQLTGGLEMLEEKIVDAATGGKEARRQFAQLGISFRDLEGKSPVEKLILIQEALDKIDDAGRRVAAVSELMGGGFGRLFAGDRIAQLAGRARELGVTEDASRRQAAGTELRQSVGELGAAIGARVEAAVAPLMVPIATFLSRTASRVAGRPVEGALGTDIQRRTLVVLTQIRDQQRRASGQSARYGGP